MAYATKAFLCLAMARLAHEEGMWPRRVHRRGAARGPVGRRPRRTGWCSTGTTSPTIELASALDAGVGRIVIDSFDEIDRIERLLADRRRRRRRRAGPDPRCWPGSPPGWRSTPTSSSAPDRTTPSSGSGWPRGRPPSPSTGSRSSHAAGIVEFVGIHAHLGSQVFALAPFARAIEVLAEFFAPLGLPELVVGGGLGVPYVNGEEAPPMAQWAASVRRACRKAGIPDSVRVTAEPGRSIVAAAAITLYRVGTIKDVPGHRTYVSVDGGMSDNPAPGALRQRLRGVPAPGDRRRPPHAGPGGRQALRDR